jgi:hypothetical protein
VAELIVQPFGREVVPPAEWVRYAGRTDCPETVLKINTPKITAKVVIALSVAA